MHFTTRMNTIPRGVARIFFRGGEEAQKKFPERSQKYWFEALTLRKIYSTKALIYFENYIKIAQKFIKFFQFKKKSIKVKNILRNFQIVL